MKPFYEHAGIVIYHGDCRAILPSLPKCDLLLTDPPYGVKMSKGFEGFGGFGAPIARKQYPDTWDEDRPDAETFQALLSAANKSVIWGGELLCRSSSALNPLDYVGQAKHDAIIR